MEARPPTSSGASHDGSWAFLNNGRSPAVQDAQTQSRQSSSHQRGRDGHSIAPLPNGQRTHDGTGSSRSFSRNLPSASIGARSTTTLPSQPVLSRIHSEYAYGHNNQFVRRSRRPMEKTKSGLPAVKEFSMAGILAAIEEDIEGHVNTISEILGRNRFVLADEYGAQMPPQGEIIEQETIAEEPENLDMADNVIILNDDASLIDGSASGSAAYEILERMQAHPRPSRMASDSPVVLRQVRSPPTVTARTVSSPPLVQPGNPRPRRNVQRSGIVRRDLPLLTGRGTADPIVSETWLSPEADGIDSGMVPTVAEAGRHYPLYTHDDAGLFQTFSAPEPDQGSTLPASQPALGGIFTWFVSTRASTEHDVANRLRDLLNR